MLITRSRARGGSLSYLLTNNFNDMTIMMMIPQIHHAHCMQQQHSYHSDIYIVFIHTDRRILTSEGRSGKASGSAAAVCQIMCWVSLFLREVGRGIAERSWRRCARECRCRRTTTERKQHGGGWRNQMADVTTEILKHEIECMKNVLVDLFTEK